MIQVNFFSMLKIDAHHHLWQYNPREHGWITDDMKILRRDFMPDDLFTSTSVRRI